MKDNEDRTAAYYADFYGTLLVVKILMEHGTDVSQFREGARAHNSQHWRGTVWRGVDLVNRAQSLPMRQRRSVRFEDYMMKTM
jgi:hypothetical protein